MLALNSNDCIPQSKLGLVLDCKSTKNGETLRFKFSRSNPHAHRADGYVFCYVDAAAFETRIHILGFAHKADIQPFKRFDGVKDFVRLQTLKREGILKPVSMLKEQHYQTISTHTLQPINQ